MDTIKGKVMSTNEQSRQGRGKSYSVRFLVVREAGDSKYPRELEVEFFGESACDEAAKANVGADVEVDFDTSSRWSDGRDGRPGRYWTKANGRAVRVLQAGRAQHHDVDAEEDVGF